MPPTRTARTRKLVPAVVLAVGALIAAPIVVHAAKDSPVATASAADSAVFDLPSIGRVESCVLDAYSSCTVVHGFGKKPVAITATASGPAILSIDPAKTTDQSYRLRALRYDGQKYRAGAADHTDPDHDGNPDEAADHQHAGADPDADDHVDADQAADVDSHHDHTVDDDPHVDWQPEPDLHQPVVRHHFDEQPG